MKTFFKLSMGVLALSLAQQASAATYTVRVTGATAFRSATHKAIVNFLGGNATTGIPVRMAHSGGTVGAAAVNSGGTATNAEASNYATYIGTNGGDTYTIQATFTGSVEGIRDVGQGLNIPFIPASEVPATDQGFALAKRWGQATSTTAPPNATEIATSNMAFSDVDKTSTDFATVDLNTPELAGIIPFIWVANRGSTLTNVTPLQARALLTNGFVRKSLFTGVIADGADFNEFAPAADTTAGGYVVLTGRNALSGTRVATLAETQHGVFNPVQQFKLGATSGTQITSLELWPNTGAASTGDDPTLGNGGYTSGSGIASAMAFQGDQVDLFFIDEESNTIPLQTDEKVDLVSYVGVSDASTTVTNLGVRLGWNGVTYAGSADNQKIINGQYTFWSSELLFTKGTLSTGDNNFKTALLSFLNVQSNIGSSAIARGSMRVNRQTDGSLIGY